MCVCVLWVSSYWLDQIKYRILHRERRRCSFLLWTFQRIFQQQWRIWKIDIFTCSEAAANFFHLRVSLSYGRKKISQYSAAQTMSSILLPLSTAVGGKWQVFSKKYERSRLHARRLFLRSAALICNKTCSSPAQITRYEGKTCKLV